MDRFVVAECKQEDNSVMGIFHHNSEQPTLVTGYEDAGSYKYYLSNLYIIVSETSHVFIASIQN